jgi:alpha-N-acetylglucosaminidase
MSQLTKLGAGVAMASALNWFLKERCNSQYMWQDQNIDIPKPTPVVYPKYVASTPYKYRYYYNVCTVRINSGLFPRPHVLTVIVANGFHFDFF